MKTIRKILNINVNITEYFPDIDKEEVLFFDIETTGFDANKEIIYLMGCVYYDQSNWVFVQYFCQNGDMDEEKQILYHFFELVKIKKYLLHFNGDAFDIRYINKRAQLINIPTYFDAIESIDFYKLIKKYKNIFNLENYKLKTIERFLNIQRDDIYTGGDLIQVYKRYIVSHDLELEKSLLLHNEEDLYGLINIIDIMKYIVCVDLLKSNTAFDISEYKLDQQYRDLSFTIIPQIKVNFNINIKYKLWHCSFNKENNSISFSIKLVYGTFYHFFENYKDYYYIPRLDEAMHKSITTIMDRKELVRANKSNCYVKKEGYFIEIFSKGSNTFVDLQNKKDIYIPVVINEYKYLKQDVLRGLVTSFFECL